MLTADANRATRELISFGEFAMTAGRFGRTPNAFCNCSSAGFDFSGAEAMSSSSKLAPSRLPVPDPGQLPDGRLLPANPVN